MEKNKHIWAVIVRYLNDTMDDADEAGLKNWLAENTENRRTLHAVDQIWRASEEKSHDLILQELNLEEDWGRIQEHINPPAAERKKKSGDFRSLRRRRRFLSTMVKAAALVLIAATSVFVTLRYASAPEEIVYEPVFKEITTHPGERANVNLGEGTRVLLNADSKLIMPDRFRPDERVVELKGQAFFDVEKDPERPFYIKTGGARIKVVGTSFDIRSYDDEDEIRVVVREGTVELQKESDEENLLVLNRGYMGKIAKGTGDLEMAAVDDMDAYLGWLDGRLIFKNTGFTEVLNVIERWYDVTVIADDSAGFAEKKFTADLKTRSVEDVFEVIGESLDLRYEVKEDTVLVRSYEK